jgi:iron complex outermembrane receptor protein
VGPDAGDRHGPPSGRGAFSWRPGEATTWNVSFEQGESDFTPDAGLPVLITGFAGTRPLYALADVPRERNYRSPYDQSEQDLTRAQVDFQHQVSDRLTVRNKAYYRRLDWLSNGTIFNGVFPSQTTGRPSVSRTLLLLGDTQEFAGDQLEAVFAAGRHRILAGVEVARLADRFTLDVGFLPDVDLLDPVETAQGPVFLIPGQSMGADAETRVVAPYLVDQIAVTDRFQLLLGGRFDALDYDDPRTATERSDEKLSPLVGAVFTPAPRFSLYAHWGEAFAPPSTRVVGEREPEESTQAEVGAKTELAGGRVQATLALYQLERENVAIPDENGFTQQTGSQRSRGVELELAAALSPGLKALFSYAYTDAELTEFTERVLVGFFPPTFATLDRSGNAPAFAPEHIANLWLTRELASGLGGAVGARYLSEQFIAEDNLFALDDALVLDASLWWDRGGQRFSLNLRNLTDEEYETRGFGSTSAIPAAGFAIYGGVNYRIGL